MGRLVSQKRGLRRKKEAAGRAGVAAWESLGGKVDEEDLASPASAMGSSAGRRGRPA